MSEKYLWYKYLPHSKSTESSTSSIINVLSFQPGQRGYKLPSEKLKFKALVLRVFFSAITRGQFTIYYAETHGKVVHTSYVIPACWKFPFLKKGEWEIGPCQTLPEYRGQGIYPTVLKEIISNNSGVVFHMMVAESNYSSIKGIEKAGFVRQKGTLVVTNLKRYIEHEG